MKRLIDAVIWIGIVSLGLGIIARLVSKTIVVAPHTYLDFSMFCLLLAIALELYPAKEKK